MKALLPSIALVSVLMAAQANAHAHLEKSTPAEGSVLTSSPSTLAMTFSETARLTALSIQKDKEPKQAIKSLPSAAEETVRVVSPDRHVMSGALHFTIAAKR